MKTISFLVLLFLTLNTSAQEQRKSLKLLCELDYGGGVYSQFKVKTNIKYSQGNIPDSLSAYVGEGIEVVDGVISPNHHDVDHTREDPYIMFHNFDREERIEVLPDSNAYGWRYEHELSAFSVASYIYFQVDNEIYITEEYSSDSQSSFGVYKCELF